jgi:hypothetical protein
VRQLRYIDYECPSCGAVSTRFVYYDTELERPDDESQVCGAFRGVISGAGINYKTMEPVTLPQQDITCDGVLVPREMTEFGGYMKTIARGNGDFADRERIRLEKRSDDHWRRKGRDEAIDRERALFRRHGMVGGVK